MQVKDVMKSARASRAPAISVNAEENIDNAALIIKSKNLKSVSVVDDNGKVVGKITRSSIIAAVDDLNEDFFLD